MLKCDSPCYAILDAGFDRFDVRVTPGVVRLGDSVLCAPSRCAILDALLWSSRLPGGCVSGELLSAAPLHVRSGMRRLGFPGLPLTVPFRLVDAAGCWISCPTAFHSSIVHPALQVMELFGFCLRIPIRVSDRALDGFHRAAVVCMGYEPGPVVVGKGPEL